MLLGIDLGTGSVKALVLTPAGRVLGEAARPYPVNAPRPGWAQSDPGAWWDATAEAVHAALEAAGCPGAGIQALGLSGQMHGVVPCAADGAPTRSAILWADGRSDQELERFRRLPPEQRARLGNPPATGMAGPSLLWLQAHEPAGLAAAAWMLQPKDWLRLRLTGEAAAEPSDASATLLYDLSADAWDFALIEDLGLNPAWFAPLTPSQSIAGELTAQAATALGLTPGLRVAAGAGDTPAAMLGSGLLAPGSVQLSVGTGAQIVAPRETPVLDADPVTHCYRSATPRGWYSMAAMQNAGLALEWVRRVLGYSWDDAYREAFGAPEGSAGLTFLPYLSGERTPHLNPHARGAWVGLGLHHDRAALMRAALEGVAFTLRDGLSALQATGVKARVLRLAGGGTTQPLWRQLMADVLERPLVATSTPSASARGAAVLAGLAIGAIASPQSSAESLGAPEPVIEPHPSETLRDAYVRFTSLYPRLEGANP